MTKSLKTAIRWAAMSLMFFIAILAWGAGEWGLSLTIAAVDLACLGLHADANNWTWHTRLWLREREFNLLQREIDDTSDEISLAHAIDPGSQDFYDLNMWMTHLYETRVDVIDDISTLRYKLGIDKHVIPTLLR